MAIMEEAVAAERQAEMEDFSPTEVPWEDLCARLKMDARMELLLRLFQERYSITSSIEAFTQIPTFLGEYMVREFDYRSFCLTLGAMDEASAEDAELWTAHLAKNLTGDLVAASSLMLRLAVSVAKANQLEAEDWKDINEACSNAVRTLPTCYRLQRALPGALSTARSWLHIPNAAAHEAANPWNSKEGQDFFEETHNFPWARIEAMTKNEHGVTEEIVGVIAGHFQVVEVDEVEGMTLVTLEVLRIGTAPVGFPVKATECGDVVMFEVESGLGALLEPGFKLDCDMYEVNSRTFFMAGLLSITPEWVP